MHTAVLGSGSKGNSVYIEMEGMHILVDAGIGVRRVVKGLKEIGVTPDMLSAVFLTLFLTSLSINAPTLITIRSMPLSRISNAMTFKAIGEADSKIKSTSSS